MTLNGNVFKTSVYTSVVGDIEVETEILCDGTFESVMYVRYPDGLSDQIFTVQEGFEKLELEYSM